MHASSAMKRKSSQVGAFVAVILVFYLLTPIFALKGLLLMKIPQTRVIGIMKTAYYPAVYLYDHLQPYQRYLEMQSRWVHLD